MNDNEQRLQQLAKKLRALARQGIDGEAENAKAMLQNLIDKHGIQLDNLDNDSRTRHEYLIKNKHRSLFFAIVYNAILDYDGTYFAPTNRRSIIRIDCTEFEHLEITAKFDVYVRDFDKQIDRFAKAYKVRNRLFANVSSHEHHDSHELTDEDVAILSMASGITPTVYRKQLQQGDQ